MSAYYVGTEGISKLANVIEAVISDYTYIARKLGHQDLNSLEKIYNKLCEENNKALEYRYGKDAGETIEAFIPTSVEMSLPDQIDLMEEYLYQCDEGPIGESEFMRTLDYIHLLLLKKFFRNHKRSL